ncbi:hypothetical protein [Caulobacter vibrioides]|uniref:hypothetical protein n=1 Tax=Caulobacter vibrioides TaxID=155892 RepID=UPI0015E775F5|nr:hypothetical protein [Caulobacter vibrioides]
MDLFEIIAQKRAHLQRLANTNGALGEQGAVFAMQTWLPRPKGVALKALLAALAETGIHIRPSSFDAIAAPAPVDFHDQERLRAQLSDLVFIEIKTANQTRVKPGFAGFFFALTEGEIAAAEALGSRHRVALFNNQTGELLLTSVPEILGRSRSTNWQVSVQL